MRATQGSAADGTRRRVKARRLLLAIEPSADNLAPFDLDGNESAVFSKFRSSNVFVGADSDLFRFLLVVADTDLGPDGPRGVVVGGFDKMVRSGVLAATGEPLELAAFEDHGPMHMRADADDVKAGFIQAQYALQGHRSTWWTGAAFSAQFTTVLWAFTGLLLPKMVENM
ncbi:hypothetical protein Daus18300_014369 [Diaporthe australafricana]|uniref:Uncharacterized protein n=1 Tax=Diaporthe australafricana TaxID=127596 RepID=A0ABR3VVL3_9PEZI